MSCILSAHTSPDKMFFQRKIFSYFSTLLAKVLLTSTHNICFLGTNKKQEGHIALDGSPELKTTYGSDGVMVCEMSIKGGHFVWLPWQNL